MQDVNTHPEAAVVADLAVAGMQAQTIGSTPIVIVPDGYEINDLEQHLPMPTRKRGEIDVNDLDSFVDVVTRHGENDSTEIYRTVTPPRFVAVFNAHQAAGKAPGWADFRAVYDCPLSPEWKTWTEKNKRQMTQADFAQFIEDNLPDVAQPPAAEMLEVARTLEAKKKVNFASGIRLSNGEQEFTYEEKIEGTASKGKFKVPEVFVIGIPVFEGGPAYAVKARLRYRIADNGTLTMWFDLERPHKIVEDAVKELTNAIEQKTHRKTINGTPARAGA